MLYPCPLCAITFNGKITIVAPEFNDKGNSIPNKQISYNFNADADKINDEILQISKADLIKFIIKTDYWYGANANWQLLASILEQVPELQGAAFILTDKLKGELFEEIAKLLSGKGVFILGICGYKPEHPFALSDYLVDLTYLYLENVSPNSLTATSYGNQLEDLIINRCPGLKLSKITHLLTRVERKLHFYYYTAVLLEFDFMRSYFSQGRLPILSLHLQYKNDETSHEIEYKGKFDKRSQTFSMNLTTTDTQIMVLDEHADTNVEYPNSYLGSIFDASIGDSVSMNESAPDMPDVPEVPAVPAVNDADAGGVPDVPAADNAGDGDAIDGANDQADDLPDDIGER